MRASSSAALAAASQQWESILHSAGEGALELGHQLFAIVGALDSSPALRRALTDPGRTGEDKARLVDSLLGPDHHADVRALLAGLVRGRWSAEADFTEAVEELGVDGVLASAQARGALLSVEEELFVLDRLIATNRELRERLVADEYDVAERHALVDRLIGDKAQPETTVLVHRVVARAHVSSILSGLSWLGQKAAARRERVLAHVTVATPLTEAQRERLVSVLSRSYGQQVHLNVDVDPEVIGGVRIQIGDDLIDGAISTRMQEAERRFAG